MNTYKELISRNWLFINDEMQTKIRHTKFLIAGVGMGSFIAELLIRSGAEKLTIVDGDTVEYSNLNRQNYTINNLNKNKAQELEKKLLKINPNAKINTLNFFLNENNIKKIIQRNDIIINTIDFDHKAFFECSIVCKSMNKIEIFPINLGFGAGVFTFKDSILMNKYFKEDNPYLLKMKILNYFIKNSKGSIADDFQIYKNQTKIEYDPQLGVSSFIASSIVVSEIFKILSGKNFKKFPEFNYIELI